jgi:chromosome segregation ATPase
LKNRLAVPAGTARGTASGMSPGPIAAGSAPVIDTDTGPAGAQASGQTPRGEPTMSSKDEYQQKLEAQLREWSAKLEVLRAKADQAKAEQKMTHQKEFEALQERKEALEERLDELRASGEDAWEEVKAGTEAAWKELDDAFTRSLQRFR